MRKAGKKSQTLLTAILCLVLTMVMCSCGREKPKNTDELLNLAYKEAKVGNWDKATGYSLRATEQAPDNVTALIMLGLCQENSGKAESAQQSFKRAVTLDPGNFTAQYNLGRIYYQHGRYEDCLSPLRKAEKIKSKDINTMVLLAQIEGKLKLPSALKHYKKLAVSKRFKNRPGPWNQMGVIYAERKDTFIALKCFLQAYKLAPKNYTVVLNLATFLDYYLSSRDSDRKAIQFYRKYLQLSKINPELTKERKAVIKRIKTLKAKSR